MHSPARYKRALPRGAAWHSSPPGRAFFDEGLQAFKRGFIHHVARHRLTRRIVRGCDAELDLAIEKFFSHCNCDAWFADDHRDEFLELGFELFGFCDTVNQTARLSLLCADKLAGD